MTRPDPTDNGTPPPDATTTTVGRRRIRVPEALGRWVLTAIILGLVLWVLLANVGNLEDVGEALSSVSTEAVVLLVSIYVLMRLTVASQLALTVPGLRMTRAIVAVDGATAVSNTVPGPSGTATRLGMLRSWGFMTDQFARSWLFTSSLTNLVVLVMPVVAILIAASTGDITEGLVILALIGLAVSIAGIVVVWLMLRSEGFSRRVGALAGRFIRWLRGVAHRRPTDEDFSEAAVRFRDSLREIWSQRGGLVTSAVVATYLLNALLLAVSMRAVGLGTDVLPVGSTLVVYAFVRLLTIVNITPGGIGVTEALYVAGFAAVAPDADESTVVAGVLLFRGLTYAGPILTGSLSLLIWRMKTSWRREPVPEPVGSAAVGAVLADRQAPVEDERLT